VAIIDRRTGCFVRELNPAPCDPFMGVNLIHGAVIIIIIITTTTTVSTAKMMIQNTGMTEKLPGRSQAMFLNLQKGILSCELISML